VKQSKSLSTGNALKRQKRLRRNGREKREGWTGDDEQEDGGARWRCSGARFVLAARSRKRERCRGGLAAWRALEGVCSGCYRLRHGGVPGGQVPTQRLS
jgi:hypothetical protein